MTAHAAKPRSDPAAGDFANTRNAMSQNVVARLRAAQPAMTPALARVADYVLTGPDQVLAQTITELAEQSGSSEGSVIRLCRELQFGGFQEFKLALASELAGAIGRERAERSGDAVGALAAAGSLALAETDQLLDRVVLARVVRRVLAADGLHLFGVGASGVTASYLRYKLLRLGINASEAHDVHLAAMAAATAGKGSVFVIVSSTGSTIEPVEVARLARGRGAYVAAVTNRSRSPLTQVANAVLLAASPETPLTGGALAAKVGQLLIVDALFEGLRASRPDLGERIELTAQSVTSRSY